MPQPRESDNDVLDYLAKRGILVQPDAEKYLATKDDPLLFVKAALEGMDEIPLFLTKDILRVREASIATSTQVGPQETRPAGSNCRPAQALPTAPVVEGGGPGAVAQPYIASNASSHFPATIGPALSPAPISAMPDACAGSTDAARPEHPTAIRPFKPRTGDIPPAVRVIKDVTDKSTCEGQIEDFTAYFNNRFQKMKRMLRSRMDMKSSVPISYAKEKMKKEEVKIIGIVDEVRSTKWGYMADIEDETGEIGAFLGETRLLPDEVVGLVGKISEKSGRLSVKGVIYPDVSTNRPPATVDDPICAGFISDIHLGSVTFLENEWTKFISWLNGGVDIQMELAERMKYLVISGDLVDGIGIYPNQEKELKIKDIYAQYEEIARQFSQIPSHIHMIILPGNHDAVRPAEPQPAFTKEITRLFPKNVTFVGNPAYFTLHGIKVLAYHGRSMDDLIPTLGLSYHKPIEAMSEMLKRRHLAPIYGDKTPLAPEHSDYMVIDDTPDIFVVGHVHTFGVQRYRNVLMINSSTWQSQTPFQKMMNIQPDPCKVTVVDLQAIMRPKIIDFSG